MFDDYISYCQLEMVQAANASYLSILELSNSIKSSKKQGIGSLAIAYSVIYCPHFSGWSSEKKRRERSIDLMPEKERKKTRIVIELIFL